ncbi:hypothetical protein MFIFM68171_10267 [Madurella fahalii]|uniref:2EXR domain-containing protein n=1 Tax=Madurella fahalii TaxID=1157608 RepID=A0ABQ0GQP0_9PEZI
MAIGTIFHPFPRLPKEIRDIIWDFAIRPSMPAAHYFTIFRPHSYREWAAIGKDMAVVGDWPLCALAAPYCEEKRARSWTSSNPSAYLIDGGLWTACKESRERIAKQIGPFETVFQYNGQAMVREERPAARATGTFMRNGEKQVFATYPRVDLFCLQPLNHDSILNSWNDGWRRDDWEHLLEKKNVPMFDRWIGLELGNLALELDPAWWADSDLVQRKSAYGLPKADFWFEECARGAALTQPFSRRTVWFIDKRIRRHPDAPPVSIEGFKGDLFYGNGCKYVQVFHGDPDWITDIPAYDDEEIQGLDKTAFGFVEKLELWIDEYAEDIEERASREPGDIISYYYESPPSHEIDFGVLACLPAP